MVYKGKLTERNRDFFFDELKPGDVFTYSSAFSAKEVVKLGIEKGLNVVYCPPKSSEYNEHGCYTCKVNQKLFAKYLPTDDELEIGGMYWNRQHKTANEIGNEIHLEDLKNGNFKSAKLFLCSRDIQIGDKVISGDGQDGIYFGLTETKKQIINKQIGDIVTGFHTENAFKVIGRFSESSLPFVNKGDEFNESELLALETGGSSVRRSISQMRTEIISLNEPFGQYPKIFVQEAINLPVKP